MKQTPRHDDCLLLLSEKHVKNTESKSQHMYVVILCVIYNLQHSMKPVSANLLYYVHCKYPQLINCCCQCYIQRLINIL